MPDHPWTDEYTLLCEKCGYVIEGLNPETPCPECGLSIRESLPETRRTYEWGGCSTVNDLAQAARVTLLSPRYLYEHVRVNNADISSDLRGYWIGISVLIVTTNFAAVTSVLEHWIMGIFSIVFVAFQAWISLEIYSWLFRHVLKFTGNHLNRRVDDEISKVIMNHACFAWIPIVIGLGTSISVREISNGYGDHVLTTSLYYLGMVILVLGIIYMIFLCTMGIRYAGYANRERR